MSEIAHESESVTNQDQNSCEKVQSSCATTLETEQLAPTLVEIEMCDFQDDKICAPEGLCSAEQSKFVTKTKQVCVAESDNVVAVSMNEFACERSHIAAFSFRNLSMLLHYICAGCLHSAIMGSMYTEFVGVLGLETDIYACVLVAVHSMWGFRLLFGFLSDHFPLFEYKRKPYVALGWLFSGFGLLLIFMFFDEPTPFHCMENGMYVKEAVCNEDAPNHATRLTTFYMLVIFGVAMSTAAFDGFVVEYVNSEYYAAWDSPPSTMVNCHALWLFGSVLGNCVLLLFLNDAVHLGTSATPALNTSLQTLALGGLIMCGTMFVLAIFFLQAEQRCHSRYMVCCTHSNYKNNQCGAAMQGVASIMKLSSCKHFFYFAMFCILAPMCMDFSSPVDGAVRRYWAEVDQMSQQVATLTISLTMATMLFLMRDYVVEINWRKLIVGINILCVACQLSIYSVTCLNIERNKYLYLLTDFFDDMPISVVYLVCSLCGMSMSTKNQEGTVYNFVVTLHYMGAPLARAVANKVYNLIPTKTFANKSFNYSNFELYVQDADAFQWCVLISFMLGATLALTIVLLVPLVPKSITDAQNKLQEDLLNPKNKSCWYAIALKTVVCLMVVFGSHLLATKF